MIKYLLFDADDTLFDFKKCESQAFDRTCEQYKINSTQLYNDYVDINTVLWKMFELGEITKERLVVERYDKLFTSHKINIKSELFNKDYLKNLGEEVYLFDGAVELCKDLYDSGKYEIYIVTNGVASTQTSRFYGSPLCNYFIDIFISEDIGYQKPSREYFDYVVKHTGIVRDESLIIGDSLSSDIKGGNMSGICTCWYNPENKILNIDVKCDYIIHDLNELRGILEI